MSGTQTLTSAAHNPLCALSAEQLIATGGWECDCGKVHKCGLKYLKIGRDAVRFLPEALERFDRHKPFIVCDRNTKAAAWPQVCRVLEDAGVSYTLFELEQENVEPDEYSVGSLCMAFDISCDVIIAIGSGVINDCCKVLAHTIGLPQMVVGTAPSMDGYASNSSSMIQNRVKMTLYNACPVAIIADTEIMSRAPMRMLWSGLGDMLAKYVSLCEWRISHLITGEYYCENVAGLMRASLKRIVDAAPRLLERDPEVIGAVTEGLILSGMAMAFAEISRPASGLEHYFSHMWEMMALDRGTPYERHGIQVGVGTLLTLRIYDQLRDYSPDRQTAERFMESFDEEKWERETRRILGKAADAVITAARHNKLNDPTGQHERLNRILVNWAEIQRIIAEELPATSVIETLMRQVGMPMVPADIGLSRQDTQDAFTCSRDIRNKYLTSSMLWDLGLLYVFPLS